MIKIFLVGVILLVIGGVFLIQSQPSAKIIATEKVEDFRVFTQAVCEDKGDSKFCQDKIFYSCNGDVKQIEGDTVFCENKSLEVGKVNLGSLEIAKQ